MFTKLFQGAVICLMGSLLIGCESHAGTGALLGGAGGAAVGGAIGSMSHSRAGEGALIGAVIGSVGGALAGHSMDQSEQRDSDRAARDYDAHLASQRYQPNHNLALDAPITRSDIVTWTQRGVRDDVIIDRIERSRTVFQLTAADENWLRDHGVSAMVIATMRDTSRR